MSILSPLHVHASSYEPTVQMELVPLVAERPDEEWTLDIREDGRLAAVLYLSHRQLEQLQDLLRVYHAKYVLPRLAATLLGSDDPRDALEPHSVLDHPDAGDPTPQDTGPAASGLQW